MRFRIFPIACLFLMGLWISACFGTSEFAGPEDDDSADADDDDSTPSDDDVADDDTGDDDVADDDDTGDDDISDDDTGDDDTSDDDTADDDTGDDDTVASTSGMLVFTWETGLDEATLIPQFSAAPTEELTYGWVDQNYPQQIWGTEITFEVPAESGWYVRVSVEADFDDPTAPSQYTCMGDGNDMELIGTQTAVFVPDDGSDDLIVDIGMDDKLHEVFTGGCEPMVGPIPQVE